MPHFHGQIMESDTPTQDLFNALITLFEDHPGWEVADDLSSDAGRPLAILRSLGSVNSWGEDFYLRLMASSTTDDSNFVVAAFEEYDGSDLSNSIKRYCAHSDDNFFDTTTGTFTKSHSYTYYNTVLSTSVTSSRQLANFSISVSSGVMEYWVNLTNDYFAITTTPGIGGYAGLYESFLDPAPDGFVPLVVWHNFHTSSGMTAVSQTPFINPDNIYRVNLCVSYPWVSIINTFSLIPVNRSSFQGGRYLMGRVALRPNYVGSQYFSQGAGGMFGLYYDLLYCSTNESEVNRGDEVTVNEEDYWYAGDNTWFPKVTDS